MANSLSLPVYNLARAGSSNDRILRSTLQALTKARALGQNPLVILGWSFLHRIEVWYHGPNDDIVARAPDQFDNDSQLRLVTLDWVPDNEVSAGTKEFLSSIDTIDKKIIDWYLHLYLLAHWLKSQNLRYLFFSAADNTDFAIHSWPVLCEFDFVQEVLNDPCIYQLHNFCMQKWAGHNDPDCHPVTGHLSAAGHEKFAHFILDKIS